MAKTILDYVRKPGLLFVTLGHRGWWHWMNDETYLKIAFRSSMGKKLRLDNPQTYSEKLQWIKLHDRKPEYTAMVDKHEAKKIAAELIGDEYIIPTLGVWDRFKEIDFDSLPNQFVLKCTHDSGGLVIVKDKNKMDMKAAKKKITTCLRHNFFWMGREWPYKDIQPKIIAEQYMEDAETGKLPDYKFFAFNGEVKALFIATERGTKDGTKFDFFDADFNHLPFINGYPNAKVTPKKPAQFELMKELASNLSAGIPQIRIDLYEVNGRVYFGEFTFFHWSGFKPFEPEEWDHIFGKWIKLPQKRGRLE